MTPPPAEQPPLEREIKIPVAELESVRRRLDEVGAQRTTAAGLERNWVLDRGELLETGQLLRLRQDTSGCRLTYKGPVRYEGGTGAVKVRAEREVAVADGDELLAILQALGYGVVRRYEKRREEWRLDGAKIALDDTPLGAFVEVEGGDPELLARRLGIDPGRAVRGSYLALWEAHRRAHPEAGPDMVFAGAAPADGERGA